MLRSATRNAERRAASKITGDATKLCEVSEAWERTVGCVVEWAMRRELHPCVHAD